MSMSMSMSMSNQPLVQPLEKVEPNEENESLSKDLAPPLSKVDVKVDVKVVVEALGEKYCFDGEEALRWLIEENIVSPNCKSNVKKSNVKKSNVSNVSKVSKEEKRKYPLPFNGLKNDNCCNGIVKNHGLYTQCEKRLPKDGKYCKGCEFEPYGNIEDRLKVDLYEYKDPKGKSPIRYTEVLKKLKISKEMIEEESKRLKITINEVHFEEVANENENVNVVKRGRPKSEKVKESTPKSTGKKGRPKKETKKVEVTNYSEEEDLFATLLANASLENEVLEKVYEEKSNLAPKELVEDLKKQRKAEDKAAKEAEKQMKIIEKAAAKEAEKQKKAEEKAAKEAEKQKKAEEKAAKEGKKKSNETSKSLAQPLVNVDEDADVVRKIEYEGKPYYKSKKSNVIYNMDEEVVGKWNEERKVIDFEEDEEEEEEYDD